MAAVNDENIQELKALINAYGVRIRYKKDGYDLWWHKVIGFLGNAFFWVLRAVTLGYFSLRFDDFNTQMGDYMYLREAHRPLDLSNPATYRTVRHEFLHFLQWQKLGPIKFALRYYVLPLPVFWTGRAEIELEAYTQDMLVFYELKGRVPSYIRKWVIKQLTSPSYGWMMVSESKAEARVDRAIEQIEKGKITGLWPYKRDVLTNEE